MSVAALVIDDGGSEDEAIAALLHDAVEDHGGARLDEIDGQFGPAVAQIVRGCTDPPDDRGLGWRKTKEQHIRALERSGSSIRRVSLAEKLDNARALLRDYRRFGDALWHRMEVEADDILWYTDALADLFGGAEKSDMAAELRRTADELLELSTATDTAAS